MKKVVFFSVGLMHLFQSLFNSNKHGLRCKNKLSKLETNTHLNRKFYKLLKWQSGSDLDSADLEVCLMGF